MRAMFLVAFACASSSLAMAATKTRPIGATVAELVAIARSTSAEVAAAALKSAQGKVESVAGSLADVHFSEKRLRLVRIDVPKLETEQQITVADIEKAIGGDL